MRRWFVLVLFLLGLGTLRVTACGKEDCVRDVDCDDGDPCTSDWCPEPPPPGFFDDLSWCDDDEQTCQHSLADDGTPCGSGRVCVEGVCGENLCGGVVCDDGLDCTDDECVFKDGECRFTSTCYDKDDCTEDICDPVSRQCEHPLVEDMTTSCGYWVFFDDLYLLGICEAGVCVGACDPGFTKPTPCPVPDFEDWVCCPGWSGCKFGYSDCPPSPVTDCGADYWTCRVDDSLGICVDGDCLVEDCSGVEDGTECIYDTWDLSPGRCEAGSCAWP